MTKSELTDGKCDLLIVGGGPAGLSAAVYGATEGLSVSLIDPSTLGGQASHSARIVNYLGFPKGISGDKLMSRAAAQAVKYGTWVHPAKVTGLASDGYNKVVQLDTGILVPCRSILLAMGVQYRKWDVPGANTFGVFYGHNPHEIRQWKDKKVVIIGGANSAGQAAWHFSQVTSEVTLLSRSPLTKAMSDYLIKDLERLKVHIKEGVETKEIKTNKFSKTLFLSDGSELKADGIFLFIGATPKTDWVPVTKDDKGFIVTGQGNRTFLETSIEGVFAAGDVRSGTIKRVNVAVGEGANALSQIHHYLEEK